MKQGECPTNALCQQSTVLLSWPCLGEGLSRAELGMSLPPFREKLLSFQLAMTARICAHHVLNLISCEGCLISYINIFTRSAARCAQTLTYCYKWSYEFACDCFVLHAFYSGLACHAQQLLLTVCQAKTQAMSLSDQKHYPFWQSASYWPSSDHLLMFDTSDKCTRRVCKFGGVAANTLEWKITNICWNMPATIWGGYLFKIVFGESIKNMCGY